MPGLRFVHASDFHLEQTPFGLSEVPEHLRATLFESPYRAATQVFDAACHEGVDFVVLAGDLAQVHLAGPRSVIYLLEQFQRLADAGIEIYWACGRSDAQDHWPEVIPLPHNVHVFPL